MYDCIICKQQFKTLIELETHIRRKHEIHAGSERVLNYLKALKIRDEILDKPKDKEMEMVKEVIQEEKEEEKEEEEFKPVATKSRGRRK